MLNITIQTGRMANTPELYTTPGGVPYTRFRLAVERDYAVEGERPTDFLSFIAWRKTAEFVARNFAKGSMVTIQGHLEDNTWKNGEGKMHYGMVVKVDQAWFAETKRAREEREHRNGRQDYPDYGSSYAYTDEDVPPEFTGVAEGDRYAQ